MKKQLYYFFVVALFFSLAACADSEDTILPPVANFSITGGDCDAPCAATFTNTSIMTGNTQLTWDFGDGQSAGNEQSVTHTYQTSGTYTVRLTAQNEMGTNYIERDVTINSDLSNLYNQYLLEYIVLTQVPPSFNLNYNYIELKDDIGQTLAGDNIMFSNLPGTKIFATGVIAGNRKSQTHQIIIYSGSTNSSPVAMTLEFVPQDNYPAAGSSDSEIFLNQNGTTMRVGLGWYP